MSSVSVGTTLKNVVQRWDRPRPLGPRTQKVGNVIKATADLSDAMWPLVNQYTVHQRYGPRPIADLGNAMSLCQITDFGLCFRSDDH